MADIIAKVETASVSPSPSAGEARIVDALSHPTVRQASLPDTLTTVHERKVDVSGAVSGAVVAARETKTKQGTDILGGPAGLEPATRPL